MMVYGTEQFKSSHGACLTHLLSFYLTEYIQSADSITIWDLHYRSHGRPQSWLGSHFVKLLKYIRKYFPESLVRYPWVFSAVWTISAFSAMAVAMATTELQGTLEHKSGSFEAVLPLLVQHPRVGN